MADGDRLAKRNTAIWRAYVNGKSQQAIADEYGISQSQISNIIADIRDTLPETDRAHLVQRETEFLDQLRAEVLDLWHAHPIPAYSNGKPIMMWDGETIAEDHTGRLAALDRAIRLHERLSKLLALDAAVKHAVTVTPPEDIELVQRIQQWRATKQGSPMKE